MAKINSQGYVVKQSGPTEVFMIKTSTHGTQGHIYSSHIIFPKHLVGRRVMLKVEFLD